MKYRPITYLLLIWKIVTPQIKEKYSYLFAAAVVREAEGILLGNKWNKDLLNIDQHIFK